MPDVDYVAILSVKKRLVQKPIPHPRLDERVIRLLARLALLLLGHVDAAVQDLARELAVMPHLAEECQSAVERDRLEVVAQGFLGGVLSRPAGLDRSGLLLDRLRVLQGGLLREASLRFQIRRLAFYPLLQWVAWGRRLC